MHTRAKLTGSVYSHATMNTWNGRTATRRGREFYLPRRPAAVRVVCSKASGGCQRIANGHGMDQRFRTRAEIVSSGLKTRE